MPSALRFARAVRRALVATAIACGVVVLSAPAAEAQTTDRKVLIYTGTTGFRHTDAINNGRPVVQNALQAAGYTVTWEDCDNLGGAANNCDNPDKNPRIFTDQNLDQYAAIVFLNASWSWAGGNRPGPLLAQPQRDAVIRFVQEGGGIAAVHNSTDMGAGQSVWDWWDGGENSVIGTTMLGHSSGSSTNNPATVQVADRHHLSTRDLEDSYQIADEHYNFARNVRGDHHVLATFDERTYNTGTFSMGQDHPTSWCKLYQGNNVDDGTGIRKPYSDGRTWNTSMGHYGVRYTEANSRLVKHIVGGIRWVAGEGDKTDCSGTVWANFKRTILVSDVNGPMSLDVADDGKVYWTEVGPTQGYTSQGFVKMHDPKGPPNNSTTVAAIPTRADHGNSEDGVLGMSLEPGFNLSNPSKRDIYVYYSPRNPAWPTSGDNIVVGYNLISRFRLNRAGTAFELASGAGGRDPAHPFREDQILRVPKAKISGNPSGFNGGPRDSGPGHVGGAGMDFDSQGNLYLGVGDDVSPNASGHNRYAPMDYRAAERWDARKTSANTADLRGKVLRIRPIDNIVANTEPGLGRSYSVPPGNMFPAGMANARPEIYAMGFRQPFTVQADPANPGAVVVGEFCHDNSVDQADRSPAGVCEWNLVDKPGFHGWPFCVGDNSLTNTMWRWNYASNTSTGQQYNCSLQDLPSDIEWAPPGQAAAPPTFLGRATIPGPATPATVWRKYPNNPGVQNPLDFGDLSAGGQQPITGPVYRFKPNAGPGAFPAYYDGSWLIANRGTDTGFWKEVRLREDTNHMLRVNDWVPTNNFGPPNNSFVIPSRFGPDGALYMARWSFGCCRNQLTAEGKTELIKIEFAVTDDCTDTAPPTVTREIQGELLPDPPNTYRNSATLTLTSRDVGCAGLERTEYRINGGEWTAYTGPVPFEAEGSYTVEYRATDRSGNTSAVQTVTFAVKDDAQLPLQCDSFAKGVVWDPTRCDIAFGGQVTWHFDQPDAQFPHDVWLVRPGGNPDPTGPDLVQVTNGPVAPGGPPVSSTFSTAGSWQFICRIHSGFSGGQWSGMVGTVNVGAQ
jgi:plastocyanin